ncbi:MAG TPA: alpha/beta hydrolase, partial [Pirellulaceae bacterium]|nr:alpha/beta hydrolase [Pirellulaceae bacterium]
KEIGPEEFRAPRDKEKADVKRLANVSKPTLTIFQPPQEKRNGAAVIVCPGGGYNILAWDLEGTEVAEWANSLGLTAFVLKYRVPKREGDTANTLPLMDAQRAMSLVRSKASDYGIDPARIGMLGFSAGGNLTAATCLKFSERQYDKLDAVDDVSCRPDFGVLIYPAYLVDNEGKLKPEYQPTKETPPMFFAHALNDGVTPDSSIALTRALKAVGVHAELHVYDGGGHGFGLRKSEFPVHTWPARCGEWLAVRGFLKPAAPTASLKGTVTIAGAPLPEGKVELHAAGAEPVVLEIRNGAYSATVPIGKFSVTILGKGVPEKYSAPAVSPLKVEITATANEIRFDLK